MEWGAVAYLSHSKYGTCTDGKYYDKYSYVSDYKNTIISSKSGDSFKEVIKKKAKSGTQIYRYSWHNATSYIASSLLSWFHHGGNSGNKLYSGIFHSSVDKGGVIGSVSTHLIITP